jgi:hypothetical protein
MQPVYTRVHSIKLVHCQEFATSPCPFPYFRDCPESPHVIVLNETVASRWRPGQSPIGTTTWLECQGKSEDLG